MENLNEFFICVQGCAPLAKYIYKENYRQSCLKIRNKRSIEKIIKLSRGKLKLCFKININRKLK